MKTTNNSQLTTDRVKYQMSNVKCQPGQILVMAVVFITVILIMTTSLFTRVADYVRLGANSIIREQATNLAEAGVDRTLWKLNQTAGVCSDCGTEYTVGSTGTFKVTITNKTASLKTITSTGYVPNSIAPRAKRTVKVDVLISSDSEDIAFRYAMQTGEGGLDMANTATINGSVYSNGSITGSGNSKINGDAYAVGTISSPDPEVTGTVHPSQSPEPVPTIVYDDWKDAAEAGGTIDCAVTPTECSINSTRDIGPKKYIGNLVISNNAIVTLEGPVWLTGNFSMTQGGTTLKLDNAFGSNNTVVIIDGTLDVTQGGKFEPTNASPKGYIAVVVTSTGSDAVQINQAGATAIFYALEGTASLSQSANVTALIAKTLSMANSATLNFDTGLASATFSTGPGASWQIKKGTYRISN